MKGSVPTVSGWCPELVLHVRSPLSIQPPTITRTVFVIYIFLPPQCVSFISVYYHRTLCSSSRFDHIDTTTYLGAQCQLPLHIL
ncbi:hypothetical protein PISMIDRAFT_148346 [Pisolithus microcarpus 441]|uniref:Uncharacterized protein n=1 Tax=Pisolithus microcarpus 441 TaxID=765257 RepID=A0A0D0A7D4_9AGAM|nr:hypothetical protein BKA83DRAFT_148346 [Pisolithus microcarpus]KIK27983.1 hypothetical protein PISMIDRAFT_148346 [Pisolithus microcarpus 441]